MGFPVFISGLLTFVGFLLMFQFPGAVNMFVGSGIAFLVLGAIWVWDEFFI